MLGDIFEISITTLPISGDAVVQDFFKSIPQLEKVKELDKKSNATYIFRRFKVKRSGIPIYIIDEKRKGGRPSILTDSEKRDIIEKKSNGASVNGLAKQYKVPRSCIYNLIGNDKDDAAPKKLEISIATNTETTDEDIANFFEICPQLEFVRDIRKSGGYSNGILYRQIEVQFRPDFHFRTGTGGRPRKLSAEKERELKERLCNPECNKTRLAKEYGISRTKVIAMGKDAGVK